MANIIVIDSEDTVRTVITKILTTAGHDVRACEGLSEALNATRKTVPDLVMTNVYLRDGPARDVLTTLRREMPDVPLLMVSGLPDQEVIDEWRDTRGFDVFPKPFSAQSLVAKVREMLP